MFLKDTEFKPKYVWDSCSVSRRPKKHWERECFG